MLKIRSGKALSGQTTALTSQQVCVHFEVMRWSTLQLSGCYDLSDNRGSSGTYDPRVRQS